MFVYCNPHPLPGLTFLSRLLPAAYSRIRTNIHSRRPPSSRERQVLDYEIRQQVALRGHLDNIMEQQAIMGKALPPEADERTAEEEWQKQLPPRKGSSRGSGGSSARRKVCIPLKWASVTLPRPAMLSS